MAQARRALRSAAALAVVLVAPADRAPLHAQAALDVLDREFAAVIEQASPAVVRIGNGMTGVCVSDRGHILTHVVVGRQLAGQAGNTVTVTFPDQRTWNAVLVALDESTGTSLLRIDERRRFPAVRPGHPAALAVGHFLLTIGNSFDSALESSPAATLGVLATVHRDAAGRPVLFETSAATNPGQSGGPFFDADGFLVGLAHTLPTDQDLATVIPVDRIREAYRSVDASERVFGAPPSLRPPRTHAQILSRAFALAATRAREGLVTLHVTRPRPGESAEAADAGSAARDGASPPSEPPKDEKPAPETGAVPGVPLRDGPLTGTIVDARGFVLAPLAELEGAIDAIDAVLHDGRRLRATVVARDRKAGFALLLIDKPTGVALPVLETRAQDALELGQFVLAVGAPHATTGSEDPFVTVGILSARHRLDAWRDALQTDAGINVKNAGGALVDLRGRLLGVVLPPRPPFGQNSGLGFVFPMSSVTRALETLSTGRDVEPAYLGVQLGDAAGGKGVAVLEVITGHAAERAGLQAGDVITHVDGTPVVRQQDLSEVLVRKSPGDRLALTVLRAGASVALTAELERRPGS